MAGIRIVLLASVVTSVLGMWYGVTRVMLLDQNADVGAQPWLFAHSQGTLHAIGTGLSLALPLALPLSAALCIAARLGPWPKIEPRALHRPLFGVVSAAILGGVAAGAAALLLSERRVWLTGVNTARLTEQARDWLLADLWFREGFVMAGGFGLFLFAQAAVARRRQWAKPSADPAGGAAAPAAGWNALRFSMRTFLLLMLGAALIFGVVGRRVQYAATQQQLLSDIRARGVQLRAQQVGRVDAQEGERLSYAYLPAVVLVMDRSVAHDDVLQTLRDVPYILQLDVIQPTLDEPFWEELLRHQELSGLRIISPAVHDEHVRRICRLPHLQRLSLDGCPVTDAVIPDVIRHGDWEGLSFRATLLSRDGLDQLRAVTWPDRFIGWPVAISEHQREFSRLLGSGASIHSGPNGGEYHLSLNGPAADLTSLGPLPIESVRVRDRRLSDDDLAQFIQMPKLKTLVLRPGVIQESQVPVLARIASLERLDLSGSECTGETLAPLAALPKLRSLQLNGCPLTRAGLEQLTSLRQLEELGLAKCNLSNDDLARLKVLPRLTTLGLSGERITDAGVDHLEQLAALEKITLWPTSISETRLARWRRARPDLLFDVRSVGPNLKETLP